jgi:hypothetical protein
MPSPYTRLCSLCSYGMHYELEKEDDVEQEAVSSCRSLDTYLVEDASCSYKMHNSPQGRG